MFMFRSYEHVYIYISMYFISFGSGKGTFISYESSNAIFYNLYRFEINFYLFDPYSIIFLNNNLAVYVKE